MTISQKLTIELIRYEISGVSVSEELLGSVTDEVIESVYKLSMEQDVAYIVGSALSKLGLLSGDIKAAFFNEQLASVYRYERIRHELDSISELFEDSAIAFIPLKGSVLREYYPKPEMRTSCDIDILIHKSDIAKATELLQSELKYRYFTKSSHDVAFMSPTELELELHFSLHEMDNDAKVLLDSVWDYSYVSDGYKYKTEMQKEYFVLYHINHMHKHVKAGGCGLRPFLDLCIIKNSFGYDEQKFTLLLEKASLKKFSNGIFNIADAWFGTEAKSDHSELMADFVFSGGAYGTFENQVAVSMSQKGTKLKALMDRVFMPYTKLKLLYPVLVEHPMLTPIYEVKRWHRIIFKDKMKNQKVIMKHNLTLDNDKRNDVARLADYLGLK